jgi:hypothetical protein
MYASLNILAQLKSTVEVKHQERVLGLGFYMLFILRKLYKLAHSAGFCQKYIFHLKSKIKETNLEKRNELLMNVELKLTLTQ